MSLHQPGAVNRTCRSAYSGAGTGGFGWLDPAGCGGAVGNRGDGCGDGAGVLAAAPGAGSAPDGEDEPCAAEEGVGVPVQVGGAVLDAAAVSAVPVVPPRSRTPLTEDQSRHRAEESDQATDALPGGFAQHS